LLPSFLSVVKKTKPTPKERAGLARQLKRADRPTDIGRIDGHDSSGTNERKRERERAIERERERKRERETEI
jgi:hypothetical protein